LTSEATAWGVAALRGVGMGVGFAVMWALVDSAWDGAVPYVDPVMVLVTCVAFLPAPLAMVRATLNELLERAPRSDVQAPVHEAVAEVCRRFGLGTPDVRIAKVGPKLYVEVEAPADGGTTIAAEHEARTALRARLTGLPYEIWLTFELTPATPD
jgi:predicted Co/Zn/Cd cation transporter (cation efflux family)